MNRRRTGVTFVCALTFGVLAVAGAAVAQPNFTGIWKLDPAATKPGAARLTPQGAAQLRKIVENSGAGSESYARTWCTYVGLPQMLQSSAPLDVRQNWREVAVVTPTRAEPRHIYIDPRIKPDPDVYDPTTNGFSTGRWRGNSLVVDTQGFSDNGVRTLPGGGLKSSASKLREVISLVDKDTFQIVSTWTDKTTLKKPHTYTQVFRRVPGQTWIADAYCTPIVALRALGTIVLPPGEGGSGQ